MAGEESRMFYRKKPVVVEARKWDPDKPYDVLDWLAEGGCSYLHLNNCLDLDGRLEISTLEGRMKVRAGAYIIRGVRKEHYPCEASIFEETYEAVNGFTDEDIQRFQSLAESSEVVVSGLVERLRKQQNRGDDGDAA